MMGHILGIPVCFFFKHVASYFCNTKFNPHISFSFWSLGKILHLLGKSIAYKFILKHQTVMLRRMGIRMGILALV